MDTINIDGEFFNIDNILRWKRLLSDNDSVKKSIIIQEIYILINCGIDKANRIIDIIKQLSIR
jgi:hypothetical protein